MRKKRDRICKILIGIGFFIAVGTAGAMEISSISIRQACVQLLFASVLMVFGYGGRWLTWN